MSKSSRVKGFYKLKRGERLDALRNFGELPVDQTRVLGTDGALPFELADLFIENAVGSFPLPFGVATNFKVNGKEFLVPMAVEESSVIAAASNAAKWVYESGGFQAQQLSDLMIGQVQILDVLPSDFDRVGLDIYAQKSRLLKMANDAQPRLLMRGGGAKDLEIRFFPNAEIPFIVVHLLVDTKDAMGANMVNTMCERLSEELSSIAKGRAGLRILSNLADRRVFRAECRVNPESLSPKNLGLNLSGKDVAQRIVEAFVFADNDSYRATTHNKGIMNGIDPVVIATGNDWRAIEAGAHAFAAQSGRYRSLSKWRIDSDGFLCGSLEVPLQVGTVGGVTRLHPTARVALQMLGNPDASTLGQVIACAGLASNLAALRALTTTGIQSGHMKLHAKNLALAAGANGAEVDAVASLMVLKKRVSASFAEEALIELRKSASSEQTRELVNDLSGRPRN